MAHSPSEIDISEIDTEYTALPYTIPNSGNERALSVHYRLSTPNNKRQKYGETGDVEKEELVPCRVSFGEVSPGRLVKSMMNSEFEHKWCLSCGKVYTETRQLAFENFMKERC